MAACATAASDDSRLTCPQRRLGQRLLLPDARRRLKSQAGRGPFRAQWLLLPAPWPDQPGPYGPSQSSARSRHFRGAGSASQGQWPWWHSASGTSGQLRPARPRFRCLRKVGAKRSTWSSVIRRSNMQGEPTKRTPATSGVDTQQGRCVNVGRRLATRACGHSCGRSGLRDDVHLPAEPWPWWTNQAVHCIRNQITK